MCNITNPWKNIRVHYNYSLHFEFRPPARSPRSSKRRSARRKKKGKNRRRKTEGRRLTNKMKRRVLKKPLMMKSPLGKVLQ